MTIKIKYTNRKNIQGIVLEKIMYIDDNEIIMIVSPFFYE